jgi:hypothetical protein
LNDPQYQATTEKPKYDYVAPVGDQDVVVAKCA